MKKIIRQLILVTLLAVTALAFTACDKEADGPLAKAGSGEPLQVGDRVDTEAALEANRLMTGDGLTQRGHKVFLDGVPLSVREKDLARALPDKTYLRLAAKYDAFPSETDLKETLGILPDKAGDADVAAAVISANGQLKSLLEDKVKDAWLANDTLVGQVIGRNRSEGDWEAFIEKERDKDKTELILRR